MNNTELRIGNYVSHEGIPLKVTSLYHDGRIGVNGVIRETEELEPIMLSPEILDNLGFEYDGITWLLGRVWLAQYEHGFHVYLHGLSAGVTTQAFYLHQLQNIFYCIVHVDLILEHDTN